MSLPKNSKFLFFLIFLFSFQFSNAQFIADFETGDSGILLSGNNASIIENSDKSQNNSSKIASYIKPAGNWHAISFQFSNSIDIKKNNSLSFLIKSTTKGRVYLKLWHKGVLLREAWAPEYNFQPEANLWTTALFDLSNLSDKQFDKIEISASVDNQAEAKVYFDDFRLFNSLSVNGNPIANLKFPDITYTNTEIKFDATGSFDPDGSIKSFELDFFGYNLKNNSGIFSFNFSDSYSGKITLKITDDEGKVGIFSDFLFVMKPAEKISDVILKNAKINAFEKVEGVFKVNSKYSNPYNAEEINVNLKIKYKDSDKLLILPCFYFQPASFQNGKWVADTSRSYWMFRFTPNSEEPLSMTIEIQDSEGFSQKQLNDIPKFEYIYSPVVSAVEVFDRKNPMQYFRLKTRDQVFTPLGINLGWASMTDYTQIMTNLSESGANTIRYWQVPFNRQALEWKNDGYTHGLMRYSQAAAALNDSIFDLAKNLKMYLQPVLFQHGMFSENVNSNWSDNPYNAVLNGPLSKPEEFFYNETAKKYTKNLLRYMVARWGYSNNLFAWELFNEVQFTGNHPNQSNQWKQAVITWHDEMSKYLKSIDPFKHITTTSASDQQLKQMGDLTDLDVLQFHIYDTQLAQRLEEKSDEIKTAINYKKPVLCGEFGLDVTNAGTPIDNQKIFVWKTIFGGTPSFMWIWDVYKDKKWAEVFKLPSIFSYGNKIPGLAESYQATNRYNLQTDKYSFNVITSRYQVEHVLLNYKEGQRISQLSIPLDRDLLMQNGIYNVSLTDIETGEIDRFGNKALEMEYPLLVKNFNLGKILTWQYVKNIDYSIPRISADSIIGQSQKLTIDGSKSSIYTPDKTVFSWRVTGPGNSVINQKSTSPLQAEFSSDQPGKYLIILGMKTGDLHLFDSLNIYVNSTPKIGLSELPILIPGSFNDIYISNISDLENDDVNITWSLVSKPEGSVSTISTVSKVNSRLYVDKLGEYQVVVKYSDKYNISKSDTLKLITNNILSVIASDQPEALIFPNPGSDKILVKLNNTPSPDDSFTIVSTQGTVIKQPQQMLNKEFEIPILDSYPPIFYVKILQNKKFYSFKIIKK
jgi:hypothetical protein